MPKPIQNLSPKKSDIKLNTDTKVFSKRECQEELIKWLEKQCCKGSRAAKMGDLEVLTFDALEVNIFRSKTFNIL